MNKVYRLMPWLVSEHAVLFLRNLTETQVDEDHLLEIALAGHCDIYVNADGMIGTHGLSGVHLVCAKKGKITNTLTCTHVGPDRILLANGLCHITCDAWIYSESQEDADDILYSAPCIVDFSKNMRELLFKPADIEALAKKMNETAEQQQDASELDYLRRELEAAKDRVLAKHSTIREMEHEAAKLCQQLDQERAAREAEALEQAKFHAIELEEMRKQISLDDEEIKYLRQLFEKSEANKRVELEDAMSIIRELSDKAGNAELLQAKLEVLHERYEAEKAVREAAERRAERAEAEAKPSHLLAITGLLELLLDNSRPRYTQGSAAEAIEALHPDWKGASASKLTKLFAEAKAAAKEADKVAQAKAEAREAAARKTAKT